MWILLQFFIKNFTGLEAVNRVNAALETDDVGKLLEALQNPALNLQNVGAENITHYTRLFHKNKAQKSDDGRASLWIDDIQSCIHVGNQQTRAALKRKFRELLLLKFNLRPL